MSELPELEPPELLPLLREEVERLPELLPEAEEEREERLPELLLPLSLSSEEAVVLLRLLDVVPLVPVPLLEAALPLLLLEERVDDPLEDPPELLPLMREPEPDASEEEEPLLPVEPEPVEEEALPELVLPDMLDEPEFELPDEEPDELFSFSFMMC